MNETSPIVGWLILAASIAFVIGFTILIIVKWRKRWDVESFDGHLVRFDQGAINTPSIGRDLTAVSSTLDQAIASWSGLEEVVGLPWRVEVVPPGKIRTPSVPQGVLRDGSLVGGSIRMERCFFFTPKYWVAVVVNERTGAFVAHEVARHIVAAVVYGNADAYHERENLAELERYVKAELEATT